MIPSISLVQVMQHSDGKRNNPNICLQYHKMKTSAFKKAGLTF